MAVHGIVGERALGEHVRRWDGSEMLGFASNGEIIPDLGAHQAFDGDADRPSEPDRSVDIEGSRAREHRGEARRIDADERREIGDRKAEWTDVFSCDEKTGM